MVLINMEVMVSTYKSVYSFVRSKYGSGRSLIYSIILQTQPSLVALKTLQNVGVLALEATLADMVTMSSVILMNAMTGRNVLAMVTGAKMQVLYFELDLN